MKLADGLVILGFIIISSIPGPILMYRKRRNKEFHTPHSYFMGNRDLPPIATAISLFMSLSPLVLITDFPVEIYNRGSSPFLRCIGQSIGVVIAACFFVPMLFRLKLETTYEYAEKRYGARAIRLTSSTIAIVLQIINSALVTYSLCLSLVVVAPMPIWVAAILISVKATFSAGAGGIQTVVWTNVVHFLAMFACLAGVVAVGFNSFENGASEAIDIAQQGGRLNFLGNSFDPRDDFTLWTAVFPAIFHYIGIMFSQVAISRYTSFPTIGRCVGAVLSVVPQTIALHTLLLLLAVSVFSSYTVKGCDPLGLGRPYTSGLISHFVRDFLEGKYPGIVGAWMVTLMASTLSTLSATVNATVGLVWHDFIGDYLEQKLKEKRLQSFLKLVTIFIGLISLALALLMWRMPPGSVKLIGKVSLVLSSAFYLLHLAGALLPFVNRPGVISAILISFSLTTALAVCQFHYGYADKPLRLPLPRENCAAILANLTRTTPPCPYYTTTPSSSAENTILSKSPRINRVTEIMTEKTLLTSTDIPTTTTTRRKVTTTSTSTSTSTSTTTTTTTTTTPTTTLAIEKETTATVPDRLFYQIAEEIISDNEAATTTTITTDRPITALTTEAKAEATAGTILATNDAVVVTEFPETTSKELEQQQITSEPSKRRLKREQPPVIVESDDKPTFTAVPTLTTSASANNFNRSSNQNGTTTKHRGAHLPVWFQYILSISFFYYPIFTIVFGFLLAVLFSLCMGGLQQARTVGADCLAVSNCFANQAATPVRPDAEMWLLAPNSAMARLPQHQHSVDPPVVRGNRRVFASATDYARSVDPHTPAMMLEAAAHSNKKSGGSNSNILAAMQQPPAVSVYGTLGKDQASSGGGSGNVGPSASGSRFVPIVPIAHQNAAYQSLPLLQPRQPPEYYEDDDPIADYNSSETADDAETIRTQSTFHHHR